MVVAGTTVLDQEITPNKIIMHEFADTDFDGNQDYLDNCPLVPNGPDAGTCMRDNIGESCDNNAVCGSTGLCSMQQEDTDEDAIGDVCDPDNDNDGICDPGASDFTCSGSDNCPYTLNGPEGGTCTAGATYTIGRPCTVNDDCGEDGFCSLNQEDTYPPGGDAIGDACSICKADFECDGDVDGTDATSFKNDFGRRTYNDPCESVNPCNGDFDCDNDCDGTDAVNFKRDFGRNVFSSPCFPCIVGEWCGY